MQAIITQLRQFVSDNFLYGQGAEGLGNDDSFLDRGLIDSTGVLELVAFLEERFPIKIEDDELVPENLDSINRLARFVARKLQAHGLQPVGLNQGD